MKKLLLTILLFHSGIIFGMDFFEECSRNEWVMTPERPPFSFSEVASQVKRQKEKRQHKWFLSGKGSIYEVSLRWHKTKTAELLDEVCFSFSSIPDNDFLLQLDDFLSSELFQQLTIVIPGAPKLPPNGKSFILYCYFLENHGFKVYEHSERNNVDCVKVWNGK